jgi:multicomponent Na+:H+ antiporter subunit G
VRHAVVDALLALAVVLTVLCCAGVVLMRDPLDAVHYLAPAVLVGLAAAAAVVVAGGASLIGTRAVLVAAILLLTAPVLSHATARALHERGRRR